MTLKDLLYNIKSRQQKNEHNIAQTDSVQSPNTDLKGWSPIDKEFKNKNLRMFLFEKDILDGYDKTIKTTDFIIAENDELIGFAEVNIQQYKTKDKTGNTKVTRTATLCTQEQMQDKMLNGELPLGIKDNQYLAQSNDVAILIDEKHRGQKLGQELFEEVLMYLSREDVQTLLAKQVRPQAMNFYKRNGGRIFEESTVVQPEYLFDVNEKALEIIDKQEKQRANKGEIEM